MARIRAQEIANALKRFRKFHGRKPTKQGTVNIPYPKVLVYLGEGLAIEYRSDKKARGVPAGTNPYRHKFGPGVKVFTDQEGKTLYIRGGRLRVTDWLRD